MSGYSLGKWSNGLAEWIEGDTAFLSVVFTWKLDEAFARASMLKAEGYRIRAGGLALFRGRSMLEKVAELGGDVPDAVRFHNPMATYASAGCPVGCSFCIVPALQGKDFTYFPDFPVRPVLTDNNLSALPAEYQRHIIERYKAAGVPLLDANSGFEPKTFDGKVFERWAEINEGVWRFAYDETAERDDVRRVCKMLRDRGVPSRKIQVYVLIGNEPEADCLARIHEVIAWGGEPYAQPIMKLNAPTRDPWVRFNWGSGQRLRQMQRWTNTHRWRSTQWSEYNPSAKRAPDAGQFYDVQSGLFAELAPA